MLQQTSYTILYRILLHTGSLVGQMKYAQFTGTVQVMKAVGSHMVLTFCENLPGSQLFSIILSRKPDMLSMDVSMHSPSFSSSNHEILIIFRLLLFVFISHRICKVCDLYLIAVVFRRYQFEKYAVDQHQCTAYRLCPFL